MRSPLRSMRVRLWMTLKKEIAKEQNYKVASELELFLAKKGDKWLTKEEVAAVAVDEHGHPVGFDHMDEMSDVVEFFPEDFKRKKGEIHVLVVVPNDSKQQDGVFD